MALTAEAFNWVAEAVVKRSAIQLPPGKEYLVESRLLPLAREAGLTEVTAYVTKVRQSNDERVIRQIVEALTTNETSWFRDNSPFLALKQKVLPELLAARSRPVHLRIWSAACSTGQEPYSLAMILSEALPPTVTFEILATDLSEQVLERARKGRYSQLEVNRGLPAPLMMRYFTRVGTEWEISAELRQKITFRQYNLLESPPMSGKLDVILLRNVLIYFDLPTKRAILRRMSQVLADDGTLMLGAAETTIGIDAGWDRTQVGVGSVYHKLGAAPAGTSSVPTAKRPGAGGTTTSSSTPPTRGTVPGTTGLPRLGVPARPGTSSIPTRGARS